MAVLVVEVTGRSLTFRGGQLDGRQFLSGEIVFVAGTHISFESDDHLGRWSLHSSIHHGRPAVSCRYFNKRTGRVEERYYKVFRNDGFYLCGPRFPRGLSLEGFNEWRMKAAA